MCSWKKRMASPKIPSVASTGLSIYKKKQLVHSATPIGITVHPKLSSAAQNINEGQELTSVRRNVHSVPPGINVTMAQPQPSSAVKQGSVGKSDSNIATAEPILTPPVTVSDIYLVQPMQEENSAKKPQKIIQKPRVSTDFQLYYCCGHMNRLFDPSLKTGSHVWNKFDDRHGPLNLEVVLDEFRANIYGLSFTAIYGGMANFHLALVMFDWAQHVISIKEAPSKLCTRTFMDNNLFPWDVYQVPVYQEFQFSSSANLAKLLFTDDTNQRIDYCKSFMAALLWRYFPHCCGFAFAPGSVSFGKGARYPFLRIMSKCENPVCQLSITLLIPKLPINGNEPVKFVLFVNRNRTCAFKSWWFPYARSSFASRAQQIGDHCPHCIVDEHVTKLPPGNFTLESIRRFANSSFIESSSVLSRRNKQNVSLLDIFCYIESKAVSAAPNTQLRRSMHKKPLLTGKQKEGFILDKAKIHVIMGTSTVDCNVLLHDRFDDFHAAPHAAATIWGFPGHLNPESIRRGTKRALECGLYDLLELGNVSLISETLSKNVSYLHLLPSLQHYLKAAPSVDGFLKLVPSDRGACTCKRIIPGGEIANCVLHDSIPLPEVRPVFACSQCDQAFTSGEFLQLHTRKVHDGHKRKFPCPSCSYIAKSRPCLIRHELRIHEWDARKDYVCPHCSKAFTTGALLKNHIRIHTGEKPFVCIVCLKRFAQKDTLKKHRYIHSGQHPLACKECGQGCAGPSELKKHRRLHTGEKPFICNVCGKGFAQSGSLTVHKRTHELKSQSSTSGSIPQPRNSAPEPHVGEIFRCSHCAEAFTSDQYLQQHVQVHEERRLRGRHIICPHCSKSFPKPSTLKNHLRTHTGERPFACDLCGKGFGQRCHLTRHKLSNHSAERPFVCKECGQSFTQAKLLKKHMLTHTGERPFKCDACSKTFRQKNHRKTHHAFIHGEFPFVCDDCGHGFVYPNLLKRHVLTHTGKKPFKCNQCGRAFVHLTSLTAHKQTHAPMEGTH